MKPAPPVTRTRRGPLTALSRFRLRIPTPVDSPQQCFESEARRFQHRIRPEATGIRRGGKGAEGAAGRAPAASRPAGRIQPEIRPASLMELPARVPGSRTLNRTAVDVPSVTRTTRSRQRASLASAVSGSVSNSENTTNSSPTWTPACRPRSRNTSSYRPRISWSSIAKATIVPVSSGRGLLHLETRIAEEVRRPYDRVTYLVVAIQIDDYGPGTVPVDSRDSQHRLGLEDSAPRSHDSSPADRLQKVALRRGQAVQLNDDFPIQSHRGRKIQTQRVLFGHPGRSCRSARVRQDRATGRPERNRSR